MNARAEMKRLEAVAPGQKEHPLTAGGRTLAAEGGVSFKMRGWAYKPKYRAQGQAAIKANRRNRASHQKIKGKGAR
jgi:hypothetical protein